MEKTAASPTDALSEKVLHEQVRALFASFWSSTISAIVLAWSLTGFLYWRLGSNLPLVWGGLLTATLALPPSIWGWRKEGEQRPRYWAGRHALEMGAFSMVWGLLPLMLFSQKWPQHSELTLFLTLIVIGTGSTGAPAVAAWWPSTVAFVVPMAVCLFVGLLRHGGEFQVFLAGGIVVYAIATLFFAHRQHRLMVATIRSRFEKEALTEQLQEQIAATERASREKTRFLASASHDLRQPLHAIALFGAVLDKTLAGMPQHAHAQRLMGAVSALANSLDSMLDVSRLDAGVVEKDPAPTALNDVLRPLLAMFAARAEEKGLQLRMRSSPLVVQTDAQMLQRLLANVIDNALKYTHRGGVLVVARPRGSQVWLEVWDSGIGISRQHLGLVFEEFYQVNNPGRDRTQGLGMGLAIVQRLANLLGHPVQVDSRLQVGTRFRLTLPLAQGPQTSHNAAAQTGPQATLRHNTSGQALPHRVLLIDDEADIGVAVGALLASEGIALQAVADEAGARAAMAQAQASGQPFDLLMSDYRLAHGVDGVELAMRLRAELMPNLPLLIITGETAPERLQRIHDLRLAVLFKPVAAPRLMEALRSAMRRRRG